MPYGLSPDQHLCHTALCMEELVCNHIFMKFRVRTNCNLVAGYTHTRTHYLYYSAENVDNHSPPFPPQPSLLALAVLGCDLKLLGCDWLTAVVSLQNLADVRGGELSVCYEAVAPFYNPIAIQYPLYIASMAGVLATPAPPPSIEAASPRHPPPQEIIDEGDAMTTEEVEEATDANKDEIHREGMDEETKKKGLAIVPESVDKTVT